MANDTDNRNEGESIIYEPGTVLTVNIITTHGDCIIQTSPVPPVPVIGRVPDTAELYRAEELRTSTIKLAAARLAEVMGWAPQEAHLDFYGKAVPCQLVATLDSFAPSVSIPAAVAYLQQKGLQVTGPGGTSLAASPADPEGLHPLEGTHAATQLVLAQQAHGAEVNQLLSVVNQLQHYSMDIADVAIRNVDDAEKLRLVAAINARIAQLCAETLPG